MSRTTPNCDGCGSGLDVEPTDAGFQCRECVQARNFERADLSDSGLYASKGRNVSSFLPASSSVDVPVPVPYLDGERADLDELLERHKAGRIRPESVPLPELSAWATPSMRIVLEHMALCVGLVLAEDAPGDDGTIIYAVDWAAARIPLSSKTVSVALKRLRTCGAIRIVKVLDPTEPKHRAGSRVYAIEPPGADGALPDATGDVEAAAGVGRAVEVGQPHVERVGDASVGDAVRARPAVDLDGLGAAASSAEVGIGHDPIIDEVAAFERKLEEARRVRADEIPKRVQEALDAGRMPRGGPSQLAALDAERIHLGGQSMSTSHGIRICALCGEPLLPDESKLVPFTGFEDEDGQPLGPVDRYHLNAIHTRCKLRDPDAAEAHLRAVADGLIE